MFVDKVLFLAEKLKAIHLFSELFIYKKLTDDMTALHMLIQPLVYQVQYIFCVWLKHISLIHSTPESLIQKFSSPRIFTIYTELSRNFQNTPPKKRLNFFERIFLQLICFLFNSIYKKLTTTVTDFHIYIPLKRWKMFKIRTDCYFLLL